MAIRIVGDFWTLVKSNDSLIKRCFTHLFSMFPDTNGYTYSFNNVLVRLYEMQIFEKFTHEKLIIGKLSGMYRKAGHKKDEALMLAKEEMDREHYTIDNVRGKAIDVDKKWEQYIYTWIQKIINDEYCKNGNYMRKYRHNESMIDYGTPAEEKSYWIESEEEIISFKENNANFKDDRRGKLFPPSFSNRVRPSEEEFDAALDTLEARDLQESICSRLEDKEQRIFKLLTEEGMSAEEISVAIGCTPQNINRIIKKIRGVADRVCKV